MENKLRKVESAREQKQSSNTTTAFSPNRQQAEALGWIISKSRVAIGWNPFQGSDQNLAVATWFEIIGSAKVPQETWEACYRSAMNRRSELKAQGKEVGPLCADDLVAEWWKLRDLHDETSKTKLLPSQAAGTCLKCFGTGFERMPDNTVRAGCLHEPGDEPNQERQVVFEQAAFMRAALKKIGSPKPIESVQPKRELGQSLVCSSCNRKADTAAGWKAGDICGVPLKTNETCPKCDEKSGVLSMNKMVCRECLNVYDYISCPGQMVGVITLKHEAQRRVA